MVRINSTHKTTFSLSYSGEHPVPGGMNITLAKFSVMLTHIGGWVAKIKRDVNCKITLVPPSCGSNLRIIPPPSPIKKK
jgi:hypothetical protein